MLDDYFFFFGFFVSFLGLRSFATAFLPTLSVYPPGGAGKFIESWAFLNDNDTRAIQWYY
jgi:hypothetical protein